VNKVEVLLSIDEAAKMFHVSREKIKTWIRRGKLKAERRLVKRDKNGSFVNFVTLTDVDQLVNSVGSGSGIALEKLEKNKDEALGQKFLNDPVLDPEPNISDCAEEILHFTTPSLNDPVPPKEKLTQCLDTAPVTLPQNPIADAETRDNIHLADVITPSSQKTDNENVKDEDEKNKGLTLESFKPTPPVLPTRAALEAAQTLGWVAELANRLETAAHGTKKALLLEYATAHNETPVTAMRYVQRYKQGGFVALARKPRADQGNFRIPKHILQLVVSTLITNPAASLGRVRRILELADPQNINYRTAKGSLEKLSTGTISKVLAWLEAIPPLRYARLDGKSRKEFHRVWLGEVVAPHANAMWQLDMTRTDLMVWNPDNDTIFRTRVHAVIDVYSGAIPAFVFSQAEDQLTTNRTLMLALMEKPGEWAQSWRIHGKPSVLYWDNGKTYRSDRVHQALEALGVNIVHSRARVSHTRGKIERFFGTLHNFCSNLPGYCGSNVTERDNETIAKLWAATRAWHAAGCPADNDPYPHRLLLEDEFKRKALLWLTRDYHQEIVANGKTREQLFLETAPASSRGRYNFGDLRTVFAKRSTRTVRGNGTIAYNGIPYGVADASLVIYQGQTIEVFEDDTMPEPVLEANIPHRGFVKLEPMNVAANSATARQYRRDAKVALDELRDLSKRVAVEFINPELRYDRVLEQAKPAPTYAIAPISDVTLERDPERAEREDIAAAVREVLAEGIILDDNVDHMFEPRVLGVK
jgi:putative transposase